MKNNALITAGALAVGLMVSGCDSGTTAKETNSTAHCPWGDMQLRYHGNAKDLLEGNENIIFDQGKGKMAGKEQKIDLCGTGSKPTMGGIDFRPGDDGSVMMTVQNCADEVRNCIPQTGWVYPDGRFSIQGVRAPNGATAKDFSFPVTHE